MKPNPPDQFLGSVFSGYNPASRMIRLANIHFHAEFDGSTGALTGLSTPGMTTPLIEASFVRYVCDGMACVEAPVNAGEHAL